MLFIKYICLVIFAIIIISFTVGYASQPIMNANVNFTANVNNINQQIQGQLPIYQSQQVPAIPNNVQLTNEKLNITMFILL